MTQKGREAYVREISELKAKIADLENELAVYDVVYERTYEALPKAVSGSGVNVKKAVNRAMTDAYLQWQEDEAI